MKTAGTCIEGDCLNGTGTMLTQEGIRYQGEFTDGSPSGRGILTFPDGFPVTK